MVSAFRRLMCGRSIILDGKYVTLRSNYKTICSVSFNSENTLYTLGKWVRGNNLLTGGHAPQLKGYDVSSV